jgi:predicted nucleic acid-binding protein
VDLVDTLAVVWVVMLENIKQCLNFDSRFDGVGQQFVQQGSGSG